jgi:hypothetical protein
LAALSNVHHQVPILTPEAASLVEGRLEEMGRLLALSQYPDGAWRDDWALGRPSQGKGGRMPPPGWRGDIVATGHHLEWLILMPEGLVPPPAIRRALGFTIHSLLAAPPDAIRQSYGPYSHAARALLLWHSQPEDPSRGGRG